MKGGEIEGSIWRGGEVGEVGEKKGEFRLIDKCEGWGGQSWAV